MEKKKNKLIVIAGPTASGKTELSVCAAQHFGAKIVSADSMQIYKYMDIGTAKPTKEEMGGICHYMIDVVFPDEKFSVYDYTNQARKIIDNCFENGENVIVAGGTGLYIDHLIYNIQLSEEPEDKEIRAQLEERLENEGIEPLYNELERIDKKACEKIHINNKKRVIRALEVYYQTGKTISEQNALSKVKKPSFDTLVMMPSFQRDVLYERINKRVDIMLEKGLEDEVRSLLERGYNKNLNSMQAIGYKEIIEYIEKKSTLQQACDKIKQNTRHYAKRQLTWFRRNENIVNLEGNMKEQCLKNIENFLKR